MKTKESVSRRPNGPRTEPRRHNNKKKVLVLGPMDLRQKTPRRHKNKKECWKRPNGLRTKTLKKH